MRRLILIGLLCGVLAGGLAALEGQVENPDTLKAFTGIWAHSEDDCQKKMSGALDKGDLDRVQTSSYELVGICEDGLDMLYHSFRYWQAGGHRRVPRRLPDDERLWR